MIWAREGYADATLTKRMTDAILRYANSRDALLKKRKRRGRKQLIRNATNTGDATHRNHGAVLETDRLADYATQIPVLNLGGRLLETIEPP